LLQLFTAICCKRWHRYLDARNGIWLAENMPQYGNLQ